VHLDAHAQIFIDLNLQRKFLLKREFFLPKSFSKNQPQYTVQYSLSHQGMFFTTELKNFYKRFFAPRKPKHYDVEEKVKKIRAARQGLDYTKNGNAALYDLLVNPALINRRVVGRLLALPF
jgi:hypothetical protein